MITSLRLADSLRVLGVGQHSHEDGSVLGHLLHLLAEGNAVLVGLIRLGMIDVEGEDLVALLSEVYRHREAHVAQAHEAYLRELEDVPEGHLHRRYAINIVRAE